MCRLRVVLLVTVLVLTGSSIHMLQAQKRYVVSSNKVARNELNNKYFFAGGSVMGFNGDYKSIIVNIDYSQRILGNTYWGLSYFHSFRCYNTGYDFVTDEGKFIEGTGKNVATLSAMLYQYFPLIRGRLYLRGGIGLGAGYHYGKSSKYIYGDVKNKMLPYITAELQAIVKFKRGFELKLSPLVFTPSRINYALKEEYFEGGSTYMFDLIHISFGYNF